MRRKKIIITGGATRIGAAIAKSLADYETAITIHYNKSKVNAFKLKKELENLGSEVYLLKADLNNLKQTQALLKLAYKKMKGLNCLINNASLFENDNLYNFTNKSFTKHLNINIKAPAILIQNFKKLLNHYKIKKKLISYHKFNEKKQASKMIEYINQGKILSIISDAGTPLLSDPGRLLINNCIENKIKVIT